MSQYEAVRPQMEQWLRIYFDDECIEISDKAIHEVATLMFHATDNAKKDPRQCDGDCCS